MSALPNSSLRVMAGNTAQKPSQYRKALQIRICPSTSRSSRFNAGISARAGRAASGWRGSGSCTVMAILFFWMFVTCRRTGAGPGDTAEGGADGHADTCGVALAQYVARHHLAGNEQVRTGTSVEMDRGSFIGAQ